MSGETPQPSWAPWMSPMYESTAPANAQIAASRIRLSITCTAIAPSTIPASTEPPPTAARP
jgi:hypothetical protein